MKEIKKEIKREIVDIHTSYEAADGTIFTDKKECEKYENSAAAMLLAKLVECEVARQMDTDWFDDSGDNEYRTVLPTTQEHIDTLNQLFFIYNGRDKHEQKFSKKDIGRFVLVGYRLYKDALDWVWFYKFDYMVEQMTGGKYKIEIIKVDKQDETR